MCFESRVAYHFIIKVDVVGRGIVEKNKTTEGEGKTKEKGG